MADGIAPGRFAGGMLLSAPLLIGNGAAGGMVLMGAGDDDGMVLLNSIWGSSWSSSNVLLFIGLAGAIIAGRCALPAALGKGVAEGDIGTDADVGGRGILFSR